MKINSSSMSKILFVTISILILIVGYNYREYAWDIIQDKAIDELESYPLMEDNMDKLAGIILSKRYSSYRSGRLLLELSGNKKTSTSIDGYNHDYQTNNLTDFIQIGDSIHRPNGTDSLYIYRNSKEYYFRLGKILNKK